jgi:hypothetical protein
MAKANILNGGRMRNGNLKFFFPLIILVILSLACSFSGATQASNASSPDNQLPNSNSPANQQPDANIPADQPSDANSPSDQLAEPTGFSESDCNVSGVTFDTITVDYYVDEVYDGPYLICSFSATGSKGLSETAYFRIVAYKADKLTQFYQELQTNIKGFVDQSTEWNAQPDIPADAKDEITFIQNDSDGYIFLITKDANVQNCTMGDGYGAEKINGKYLIQLQFSSCESDAGAYMTTLENLHNAALEAILRVEESAQP